MYPATSMLCEIGSRFRHQTNASQHKRCLSHSYSLEEISYILNKYIRPSLYTNIFGIGPIILVIQQSVDLPRTN